MQKNLELVKVKGRTGQLEGEIAERQAAEESLKEQQGFLRDVIDANPNPVFVKDHEGHFTLVNKAMAELYGTTTTAIIGKTDNDLSGKKAEVERILRHDKEVIETAKRIHIPEEEFTDQKTGKVTWFQTVRTPLIDPNGQVRHILGVSTDITERRQAELSLTIQHNVARIIVESTTLPEAIPQILTVICKGMDWQICEFWDRAHEETVLRCGGRFLASEKGSEKEAFEEFVASCVELTFEQGMGLPGHVWQSSKPVWIEDVSTDPIFTSGEIAKNLGLHTALGFPIITGKKVLGVIALFSRERRVRDEKMLETLGALGSQIGQLIERKRAEEALQHSEQYFRSLIENASDIVSIVNAEGIRRYISPSVERVLGYRPAELIGQNSFELVHPEDIPELMKLFAYGAKRPDFVATTEARYRHKDGSWHTLEITGRNLLSDPVVAGIIINSRDITDRKLMEKKLIESESLKGAILGSALDCIIAMDHTGAVTEFNPAAEKVFGYSRAEVIGQELAEMIIPPALRESHRRGMAHYLATNEGPVLGKRIEISAMRADGTEFPIELAINSIRLGDQPVFTAYLRDITERKQAEYELAESERRYRLLGEGILHQVWTAQPDGKLDYFNQRTLDYFGRTTEQMKNAKWESMVHPDDVQLCVEQARRSLQTGKDYEVQFRLRRADGVYRWHLARASAGRGSNSQIVKWFGTNTDIDEQKQAEEALLKSEERLQQSQKMEAIGTLAGGVAHDFNNLLTVILGNINLALRGLKSDNPAQLRLVEAERASNRATVLTRQLLAFSRRQHLERRTINLNDTVSEIVKFLQRIIGEDVELKVKAANDLAAVFADPAQFEQVVMNLCVNARDAMPRGGELIIETSNVELDENYSRQYPDVQPGKYVEIRVSDNGTGMDRETQARIFEPFFTTKEVGKGTGLGLSMVYGIVKQHDGYIYVDSEVGHGTTFKVFLPVNEKAVEKEKQTKQIPLRGGKETILVAEDEEALRALSKQVLETLGYTVLLAKNGEEAVEMYAANRERIAMLLFDVVMPRMGGAEAFEQIHEMGGDVPLIFMTGYSSETVQSRFVNQHKLIEKLGAMVIQKPYSLEGLGRKVREGLDQAQQK
ncbi:MAG: PAS domain S-box protein [Acidobacteria bacterium]|nr:PAS domain S-box protein [Acidobacteriota bacterium]